MIEGIRGDTLASSSSIDKLDDKRTPELIVGIVLDLTGVLCLPLQHGDSAAPKCPAAGDRGVSRIEDMSENVGEVGVTCLPQPTGGLK